MSNTTPGRCYFAKRVGLRWEVWFMNSDGSPDPINGGTQWKAATPRFWRQITAERIANEMWSAFNDGVWVGSNRRFEK